MKTTFTFLVFWLFGTAALAQGSVDYYKPHQVTRREYDRLLVRYGSYLAERWYVGVEGFVRVDHNQLSNSFGGLIVTNATTKPGWSALVGWTARDWAIEAGYARSPINNQFAINPFEFQFQNNKNGFLLRGKRQLFSTSPQGRRSGVWATAGFWLIPNAGETKSRLSFEGYGRRSYTREIDTLTITSHTNTNTRSTGLLELGLEYNVKLSSRIDLGIYGRKYWGLGSSITTDLTYSVNGREQQMSTLLGRGTGVSFGIALRYTYSRKHAIPKTSIYDLRGNQSLQSQSKRGL